MRSKNTFVFFKKMNDSIEVNVNDNTSIFQPNNIPNKLNQKKNKKYISIKKLKE